MFWIFLNLPTTLHAQRIKSSCAFFSLSMNWNEEGFAEMPKHVKTKKIPLKFWLNLTCSNKLNGNIVKWSVVFSQELTLILWDLIVLHFQGHIHFYASFIGNSQSEHECSSFSSFHFSLQTATRLQYIQSECTAYRLPSPKLWAERTGSQTALLTGTFSAV